MDNELRSVLIYLNSKQFVTLSDIEIYFNITRRQAMYRIEKINDILKLKKVQPLSISSDIARFIEIDQRTKEVIVDLLHDKQSQDIYYYNKQERILYMFLMMFINNDYIYLNDFCVSTNVSKSTTLADLKELTALLAAKKIELKNSRQKGYYLYGEEVDIRRCMMEEIMKLLSGKNKSQLLDIFIDDFRLDIFGYSKLVIMELAQKYRINFVEDRLIEFIYIFIYLKSRIQNMQSNVVDEDKLSHLKMIETTKEYLFTKELITNYKNYEIIGEEDIYYIASWILGISYGDINEDTDDCVFISDIVGKLMTRFEYLTGVHYKDTEKIFIQLYAHLRPAYYRLIFRLPIINYLCERIKDEYQELYKIVESTMKPLEAISGCSIPDDEIAYLTMHFHLFMQERELMRLSKRKKR